MLKVELRWTNNIPLWRFFAIRKVLVAKIGVDLPVALARSADSFQFECTSDQLADLHENLGMHPSWCMNPVD